MIARRAGVARVVPGRRRADVGSPRSQGGHLLRRRAPGRPPPGRRRRRTARRQPLPRRAGRPRSDWSDAGSTRCDRVAERGDARHRPRRSACPLTGSPSNLTARPDRAVPDLPLSAEPTDRRRRPTTGVSPSTPTTGCSPCSPRTNSAASRCARRDGGWIDVDSDARHVRVQPRRHARTAHRRPLPVDAAPRAQHVDTGPAVVPLLLRSVVGRHRAGAPDRRDEHREHDRPRPLGRCRRRRRGTAPTATTSRPRSPRSSPNCSPDLTICAVDRVSGGGRETSLAISRPARVSTTRSGVVRVRDEHRLEQVERGGVERVASPRRRACAA